MQACQQGWGIQSCQSAGADAWIGEEVEWSQTWLSTLPSLSQRNKIRRQTLGASRNLSKWKSNDNAERISFLWNSFSSSIYSAGVNFPSSFLCSLWKQRSFLLITKLYFIKDEDNALGLEIPFSNSNCKRFSFIVATKRCENISFPHGRIYCEPMCIAEEKGGKSKVSLFRTLKKTLWLYYLISKHQYLEANTDPLLGEWIDG